MKPTYFFLFVLILIARNNTLHLSGHDQTFLLPDSTEIPSIQDPLSREMAYKEVSSEANIPSEDPQQTPESFLNQSLEPNPPFPNEPTISLNSTNNSADNPNKSFGILPISSVTSKTGSLSNPTSNFPEDESTHHIPPIFLPLLPDANSDGFSDQWDFLDSASPILNNRSTPSAYLTQADLIGLYLLADLNKDGLLSKREWALFYKGPVRRFFLKCDRNGEYRLGHIELGHCFSNETQNISGSINFPSLTSMTVYKAEGRLNFLEYLKLNASIHSWLHCAYGAKEITIKQFACTVNMTHPEVEMEGPEQTEGLFLTGQKLGRQSLKNKTKAKESMNFAVFFDLNLKFHRFLKAQRFLNKLTLGQREFLDANSTTYGFSVDFQGYFLMKESFIHINNVIIILSRIEDFIMIYGKNKSQGVKLSEFCEMFTKEMITEIKDVVFKSNRDKKPESEHLKTFFDIFDSNEDGYLSAIDLYDFYKFALAFMEIDRSSKGLFHSKDLSSFKDPPVFIISLQKGEINDLMQVVKAMGFMRMGKSF